jgi:hypothetical protein
LHVIFKYDNLLISLSILLLSPLLSHTPWVEVVTSATMAGRNEKGHVIDGVEATSDTLTSRGGLTLFVRYLRNLAIYPVLARLFGSIRKNAKGQPGSEIFKQVFCFLLDGASRHLVYFDALKKDAGYAAAIETAPEQMLSSHAVKRFFGAFSWPRIRRIENPGGESQDRPVAAISARPAGLGLSGTG